MTSTGRHAPAGTSTGPSPGTPTTAAGAVRRDTPVLELERVTLELGERTILRDTSFVVNQGEFIGVLGPNGAGKTTLMRAVLGLVPAAGGTIRVLGQAVERGNASIGYMPQTRSALAGRRVRGRDFVAMAADGHRWGLPHADAKTRADVDRVLELVGATGLAKRPLSELSGGERQRLLLAQCLLGNPKLLLLDEPLISLDPHHQKSVVELVRRVQQELGIAVLFSAHELNPLLNSIDRVLYLGSGVAALGTVDEVITRPVLSRLYGSPIDVMRVNGRIFVMSGGVEVEKHDHEHEHDEDGGHSHAHSHSHDHGHGHAHKPSHGHSNPHDSRDGHKHDV
ncbi:MULTISPECIES: ABC transporter ATP-binding protein [unclassified Paraburkholderia]|uniref:ABC transporter ATP-binding protein n=1 Tax=unclassified Paraburkholderia TaxID=2615204 RepID=UPI0019645873|nr:MULTISPECIES: ABC transporter ATP-binding protein [unclassified Paraburkholderia]